MTPFGIGRGKKDDKPAEAAVPQPPVPPAPPAPEPHSADAWTPPADEPIAAPTSETPPPVVEQPAAAAPAEDHHEGEPEPAEATFDDAYAAPTASSDAPADGGVTDGDDEVGFANTGPHDAPPPVLPEIRETAKRPEGTAIQEMPAHEVDAAVAMMPERQRDAVRRALDGGAKVVNDAPPQGEEDEYQWHTGIAYPTGVPDAVEFIDVYKAFGRNKILRGLNMGLPEGKISMILGPSGTGKSVCIKHMVGLLYPDQGDVLVHGESIPNMADDDLFDTRKKFGLLFQDGALFGSMNLFDNVAFPLRQHTDKGEDEITDIVNRRLDEVGLRQSWDKMPNELSGGMRKRAGFARALVLDPDIVLFDEPDSGLDPVRTALLGELIQEIHADMLEDRKGTDKPLPTFAVITHDIMSARRVADYINVLWKGRIVEAGYAQDMLNSENQFIRQFLSGESQGPLSMD